MGNLRRITLSVFGLLIGALVTTSAFADTVKITWPSSNDHAIDGAFLATPSGGVLGTTAFQTFCIETNEYISIEGTYTYELSDKAVHGGTGGPDPDPISVGTAWLYSQFRQGLLLSYTGSVDDQNQLQAAFWRLEEEDFPSNFKFPTTAGDIYLNAAQNALGLTTDLQQDAANSNFGNFGVFALNLTGNPCPGGALNCQTLLAYVPEPSSTLLLGMCLAGIGWFARRKKSLPPGHLSHFSA